MATFEMNNPDGVCCNVKGCSNTSENSDQSFFTFPGDRRKEAWIRYADRPEYSNLPPEELKNKKLCGAHFASNAFTSWHRHHLKRTAVPTIRKMPSLDSTSTSSAATDEVVKGKTLQNSTPNESKLGPPSSNAADSMSQVDLTQLEDVSRDIVIPNILASLPPALAQMVANSACKIQAFKAPRSTVQLILPKPSTIFTSAGIGATSQPQAAMLLPPSTGTHLFQVVCSTPVPAVVVPVAEVPQQMLVQPPTETAKSNSLRVKMEHAYVSTGAIGTQAMLEKIDKKIESVNRKNKRAQALGTVIRKRYLRLKNYLRHMNDLRSAKGLPRIVLQDDLKETQVLRRAGDVGKERGQQVCESFSADDIDAAQGVEVVEGIDMMGGFGDAVCSDSAIDMSSEVAAY